MKKLGIYIHVPFCIKKCGYCDFYSVKWDYFDEDQLAKIKDIESCVKVYLADTEQGRKQLKNVYEFVEELKKDNMSIDLGSLRVETRILNDEDWANSWKQYFKPFTVG
jgi:ribosomal protein L11 methyltransferase